VVQVIVAEVVVKPPEATALITGMDDGVEKVKFVDVAVPAELVDKTSKSYGVPGVSPLKFTECEVTGVELSVESEP
jgi:hypothetical protein